MHVLLCRNYEAVLLITSIPIPSLCPLLCLFLAGGGLKYAPLCDSLYYVVLLVIVLFISI